MSAYILEPVDLATLALAASENGGVTVRNPVTHEVRELFTHEAVITLALQNVQSVEARYPKHSEAGGLLNCDLGEFFWECKNAVREEPLGLRPHELIRLCDEYHYQSCETPDYYTSDAYWLVTSIKNEATRVLVGAVAMRAAA